MNYAVLDIETTGGAFNEEKITEIAVFKFDGKKIVDQFISLINPEKEIQPFIQKLTGITGKMVKTAPKFHEIARRLIEITDNTIIVAHNADFDYRVIKREYSQLGYDYELPTLDTIQLSKNLIPNEDSYSLGKLCKSLGIPIANRHRASGDARATVKLFEILLSKDINKSIIQSSIEDVNYKKLMFIMEKIPLSVGVFYLYAKNDKIIFLMKDVNMHNAIRKILTDNNKNYHKLKNETVKVSYELTDSKLIASIKENQELKSIKPIYNKNLRKKTYHTVQLNIDKNDNKILEIKSENTISPTLENINNIFTFSSFKKANSYIENIYKNFNYLSTEDDIEKFLSSISFYEKEYLLIGKGKIIGENSFIYLENRIPKGYGFFKLHSQIDTKKRIKRLMVTITDINLEIKSLISNDFLKGRLKLISIKN